jgi:PKD repeat protein
MLCALGLTCNLEEPVTPRCVGDVNADFSVDNANCIAPCKLTVNNKSTGATTYSWTFAAGLTSTAQSPPTQTLQVGTYVVQLIAANANGCKDTALQTVIVSPVNCAGKVIADFSIDQTTCTTPCPITFNNKTTGATAYSWTFGNGQTSTAQSPPPQTFSTPGTYTIILEATNADGCKAMISKQVKVNPPCTIVADFTTDKTTCTAPCTFTVTNTSTGGATAYEWDFGNGQTSALQSPPAQVYTTANTYTITLVAKNADGCSKTIKKQIVVNPPCAIMADFTTDKITCTAPCTIAFTNTSTGGGTSYNWDFGNGQTNILPNPSPQTYTIPNTYTITLTANNANGCINVIKKQVTITAPLPVPPTARFTYAPTTNIIAGITTVSFNNLSTGTINNYSWNFGGGITSTLTNPSTTFKCEGTSTVSLTANGPAGSNTTTQNVTVYAMNPTCNNYGLGTTHSTARIQSLRNSGPTIVGQIKVLNGYDGAVKIELFHPTDWLNCKYTSWSTWSLQTNTSTPWTLTLANNQVLNIGNDWGIKITFSNGVESCIRTVGSLSALQGGFFVINAGKIYNGS